MAVASGDDVLSFETIGNLPPGIRAAAMHQLASSEIRALYFWNVAAVPASVPIQARAAIGDLVVASPVMRDPLVKHEARSAFQRLLRDSSDPYEKELAINALGNLADRSLVDQLGDLLSYVSRRRPLLAPLLGALKQLMRRDPVSHRPIFNVVAQAIRDDNHAMRSVAYTALVELVEWRLLESPLWDEDAVVFLARRAAAIASLDVAKARASATSKEVLKLACNIAGCSVGFLATVATFDGSLVGNEVGLQVRDVLNLSSKLLGAPLIDRSSPALQCIHARKPIIVRAVQETMLDEGTLRSWRWIAAIPLFLPEPAASSGSSVAGVVCLLLPDKQLAPSAGIWLRMLAPEWAEVLGAVEHQREVADLRLAHREQYERLESNRRVTATVGHDIGTPLTQMARATTRLRRALVEDDSVMAKEQLALISLLTANMQFCVRQLADTEAAKPVVTRVSIKALIDAVRGLAEHWWADVRVESAVREESVRTDLTRVTRVLLELVYNAAQKAPRPDRFEIAVDIVSSTTPGVASQGLQGGQYLRFRLWDSGSSIPVVDRERIFQHGFSTRGGRGLGLTMSKEIMRGLHGDVSVGDRVGGAELVVLIRGEWRL